jgi:hypothetical protein
MLLMFEYGFIWGLAAMLGLVLLVLFAVTIGRVFVFDFKRARRKRHAADRAPALHRMEHEEMASEIESPSLVPDIASMKKTPNVR